MEDNQIPIARDAGLQAAIEEAVEVAARDLIDGAVVATCKYVNLVAHDMVIAHQDNEVRRILLGLLVAYEERKKTNAPS